MLLVKIYGKLKSEQRKYFTDTLKKHFAGVEINLGNTITAMSFNDYASGL